MNNRQKEIINKVNEFYARMKIKFALKQKLPNMLLNWSITVTVFLSKAEASILYCSGAKLNQGISLLLLQIIISRI